MNWTEFNRPPVSPPERRGFGNTVITLMVKQTVNGEVQLDHVPSVSWLTCAAADALERGKIPYKNLSLPRGGRLLQREIPFCSTCRHRRCINGQAESC